MKLLLDIGNSRIKWAFQSGSGLRDAGACEHHGAPAAAAQVLSTLPHRPEAAAAVNVAGSELVDCFAAEIARRFGIELETLVAAASCGPLRNGYAQPAQLGADRWAAMAGAWQLAAAGSADSRGENLLVVDAGTALTVDAVRADGQHLGGLIVPGLALMQSALGQGTSDLTRLASAVPAGGAGTDPRLADNTRSAIEKGCLAALCGLIERLLPGRAARLLLTGGDAGLLVAELSVAAELRPLLVLEGLAYLTSSDD